MHPAARLAAAALSVAAITATATLTSDAEDPTPITAPTLGPSPEGWSVDTALSAAAAQIDAAARIGIAADRRIVERRLTEIAAEQQAAHTRLEAIEAQPPPEPAPKPTSGPPGGNAGNAWDRLAQCEAGGDWATNTGNGYSGGLQWHPGTWAAYRAPGDPTQAWQASREQQIAAGERLLAASGGKFTAWPGCRAKLRLS